MKVYKTKSEDARSSPIRWMDGWTKQKVKMPDPVRSNGWTIGLERFERTHAQRERQATI